MGIAANATAILLGGILGSLCKKKLVPQNFSIFGICVSIISLVSFIENMFQITNHSFESSHLYTVILALAAGYTVGELLKLEDRISGISASANTSLIGVTDATVFFGIGGLQICGPILLALQHDSSQLYLKSIIDFPFAFLFGAIYGKKIALSAIPVALTQLVIALIAFWAGNFISDAMIRQLCSIGYVILFFSGINMIPDIKCKVKTVNMLPAIPIVILLDLIISLL